MNEPMKIFQLVFFFAIDFDLNPTALSENMT